MGRRIAGLSDLSYSAGLKAKGGTWTAANLGAFLAAPSAFAPGSKMFVSVPAPADRADSSNGQEGHAFRRSHCADGDRCAQPSTS